MPDLPLWARWLLPAIPFLLIQLAGALAAAVAAGHPRRRPAAICVMIALVVMFVVTAARPATEEQLDPA